MTNEERAVLAAAEKWFVAEDRSRSTTNGVSYVPRVEVNEAERALRVAVQSLQKQRSMAFQKSPGRTVPFGLRKRMP